MTAVWERHVHNFRNWRHYRDTINGQQIWYDRHIAARCGGTYSLASTITNIDKITFNQNAAGFNLTVTNNQVAQPMPMVMARSMIC